MSMKKTYTKPEEDLSGYITFRCRELQAMVMELDVSDHDKALCFLQVAVLFAGPPGTEARQMFHSALGEADEMMSIWEPANDGR
jgi:hypothetical protein